MTSQLVFYSIQLMMSFSSVHFTVVLLKSPEARRILFETTDSSDSQDESDSADSESESKIKSGISGVKGIDRIVIYVIFGSFRNVTIVTLIIYQNGFVSIVVM